MKRKRSPVDDIRPKSVRRWKADHVAAYLVKACGRDQKLFDAILENGIDGKVALDMPRSELHEICPSPRKREVVQSALHDLNDPLFPAFLEMDTDASYTIGPSELAHVLTRVNGSVMTEQKVQQLIEDADLDCSGDVDFKEFKMVLSSCSVENDWARASIAVGAPAAVLAAANALADSGDAAMADVHQSLQAGSARIVVPSLKGMFICCVLTSSPSAMPCTRTPEAVCWYSMFY